MLTATKLARAFLFKDNFQDMTLTDPNPNWSVEEVLNFYANTYPILATATIGAPKIADDAVQYRFESVMGTKG